MSEFEFGKLDYWVLFLALVRDSMEFVQDGIALFQLWASLQTQKPALSKSAPPE